MPRALTREEIRAVAERWGQAAARAHAAGFDVVEIHGAHGFLIHEFLSPLANQRTDEYGGSEANRMRFALEVCERVREHWPAGKPLFLRLSAEDDAGWGPEQSVALAQAGEAQGRGRDRLQFGRHSGQAARRAAKPRLRLSGALCGKDPERGRIMTMAVGLIVHADQAERILQEGRADLVALAREMLYNPNWTMDAAQKLGVDKQFGLVPPP